MPDGGYKMSVIHRPRLSVIPFAAEHLEMLPARLALGDPLATGLGIQALSGLARSAVYGGPGGERCVIGCAGWWQRWPGFAETWALVGDVPMRAWPDATRMVLGALAAGHGRGIRRFETTVIAGFDAGMHWARMLGFTVCGLRAAFDAQGRDHWLMERVRR